MKNTILQLLCLSTALTAAASAPDGYYSSIYGKADQDLKDALYEIVINHTQLSYSDIKSYFEYTDVYPDCDDDMKIVWDMYYDNWTNQTYYFPDNVSGLSREHAVPKSWWGSGSTNAEIELYLAGTDLIHLFPCEPNANSAKSNYPLGIVATASYDNGVTLVGTPVDGYGGGCSKVYEPADEYKGDMARAYFYVATCYQDYTWETTYMFLDYDQTYLSLQDWAIDMLLDWHRSDPVSDKETDRNDAVYDIQGNRNPFVDDPDLVEYIWGKYKGNAYDEADKTIDDDDTDDTDDDDTDDDSDDTDSGVTYYFASESNNWLSADSYTVSFVGGTDVYDGDDISSSGYAWTLTKDNVTVSCSSGIADMTNYDTEYYRCYSGATLTISSDYTITEILFTSSFANTTSKRGLDGLTVDDTELTTVTDNSKSWSGSASSITFTASAQVRISQIDVTYVAQASSGAAQLKSASIIIYDDDYAFTDNNGVLAYSIAADNYDISEGFLIYGDDGSCYGSSSSIDYNTEYSFSDGADTAYLSTSPQNDYIIFAIGAVNDDDITVIVYDSSDDQIDDDDSGITTTTWYDGLSIVNGHISVAEADNVRIYNVSGSLISTQSETDLPAGIYIIHYNNSATKVLIK